jgi:hypothetical protein
MREPRYPLPRVVFVKYKRHAAAARAPEDRAARGALVFVVLGAIRAGVGLGAPLSFEKRGLQINNGFAGLSAFAGFDNDPSAGSPTETLLRLLLPLNDKVQWTSRDVAGSEPPTSPRSEHFTGPFNR